MKQQVPPPGRDDPPEAWDLYRAILYLIDIGCTWQDIEGIVAPLTLGIDDTSTDRRQ